MGISYCTDDGNECQNGGVCILATDQSDDTNTPVNYCQCPEGKSGHLCHGKDVCPLDCQHGSSCRHYDDITHDTSDAKEGDEAGFYCECGVGNNYKGKLCNIPFTTCPKTSSDDDNNVKPLQCLYGGECKLDDDDYDVDTDVNDKGGNSYQCSCPKGRDGQVCQNGSTSDIQDYNGDCLTDSDCGFGSNTNNGLCIHKHDTKTTEETGMTTKNSYCQCNIGYGGKNCELNCDSLKCQHGSSCRFHNDNFEEGVITHANDKTDNGAYCDCSNTGVDGKSDGKYKGLECEIEVQVCPGPGVTNNNKMMECLFGGSCVGSQDDTDGNYYNCDCPTNRIGTYCEIVDDTKNNRGYNDDETHYNNVNNKFNDNIIQNSNDVVLSSQEQQIPTNVIVSGLFVILFSIIIIILGLMMFMKSKRQKLSLESSQRAASESLDDTFNSNDNNKEEENENNNEEDDNNNNGMKNENLDGGIVDDDFYDANGGGGDNDIDGIVNVNLDDDEPPHPKAEIV